MALSVTHSYVSSVTETTPSGGAGGTVGPTEWNATHTLSGSTDIAYLSVADQTVVGGANVTAFSISSSSAITIDCGNCPLQKVPNGGAFTITAPSNDGSAMLMITNGSAPGAVTFSGFSVGSNTGDSLTTTTGSKFTVSIWRINGVSGYRIAAHQ
jgi:hypothetical protein